MTALYWETLFYLLPYYLGSITSSNNKAVNQSYHCTPIAHICQCSHYIFSPGGLNLAYSYISWLSVFFTCWTLLWDKQLSLCACVSAGLLPCFSVSAGVSSPGGPLRMGAQGEPWSQALNATVCLSLFQLASICCQGLWLFTVGLLLSVSPCLVFIPCLWWDTNSQLLTPDTGSWMKKKQGQQQSAVANVCVCACVCLCVPPTSSHSCRPESRSAPRLLPCKRQGFFHGGMLDHCSF